MMSYKTQLQKIGVKPGSTVSYRGFFLPSRSLRQAMRSMNFPGKFDEVVPGKEQDENWTDEIQGVAFASNQWLFVSNTDKALYVFKGTMEPVVLIKEWPLLDVVPAAPFPGFGFNHFGALIAEDGLLYIDHFCDIGGQVLVMSYDGAQLKFVRWIQLENVEAAGGRVGMIAVDRQQNRIVTCGGGLNLKKVLLHRLNDAPDGKAGSYTGRLLPLDPPISNGGFGQGGFLSPNRLLYISSGQGKIGNAAKGHQHIYCYSPLNGRRLGEISVTTEEGKQELEGCCFAPMVRKGQAVQIHAVLLENELGFEDDIYLKSFAADRPELI